MIGFIKIIMFVSEGLQTILNNLSAEDKCQRPFRRSIAFGQYVHTDFVPILLASEEDKTTDLLIKILADLTLPVKKLYKSSLNAEHAIFEINNLIDSIKSTFTDYKVTKVVIDYLMKNTDVKHPSKLTEDWCGRIDSCLVLLRNLVDMASEPGVLATMPVVPMSQNTPMPKAKITVLSTALTVTTSVMPAVTEVPTVSEVPNASEMKIASEIPEAPEAMISLPASPTAVQNQFIWNIFSLGVDKLLIKLMNIPEAVSVLIIFFDFVFTIDYE